MPIGSQRTRLQIAQMDCPTEEALIHKRLGSMVSRGSGVLTYPNFGILRRARKTAVSGWCPVCCY